jgi:hypothetical protein
MQFAMLEVQQRLLAPQTDMVCVCVCVCVLRAQGSGTVRLGSG